MFETFNTVLLFTGIFLLLLPVTVFTILYLIDKDKK